MKIIQSQQSKMRSNVDAVFIGWQRVPGGKVMPLYNITRETHPLCGSTVSDTSLITLNLRVPRIPLLRQVEKWACSLDMGRVGALARTARMAMVALTRHRPTPQPDPCADHGIALGLQMRGGKERC
jgi:hypothetical protein